MDRTLNNSVIEGIAFNYSFKSVENSENLTMKKMKIQNY